MGSVKKVVERNSILCMTCNNWTHNRCSCIQDRLNTVENYSYQRYTGTHIDKAKQLISHVMMCDHPLEVVKPFVNLVMYVDNLAALSHLITARTRSACFNKISSEYLLQKLHLASCRGLRWFRLFYYGHMQQTRDDL